MVKVLKAGFYSSIQDLGRVGYASAGVPVSGVMDSYSSSLANSILNNSNDAAVLEITYGGCELLFLTETIICISGADFSAKINNVTVNLNSRIKVKENDILSFGKINYGVRVYVAVKSGFKTDTVLGSRSFYQHVTKDYILKKNDILPILKYKSNFKIATASLKIDKAHFSTEDISCFKGPEFNLLSEVQKKMLFEQTFAISNDNNRMGLRLNEIIENSLPSILTSAVIPGTIQLAPSGKLIVLMRDCQVTGGYPRILQLSELGINRLAQKTTNNTFQFKSICI